MPYPWYKSPVDPVIRRLEECDDIVELTHLLHKAYGELAAMGFRYLATHQTPEVTKERCESGSAFVAEFNGRIVGTVTFYDCSQTGGSPWYDRLDVCSFGQFAVDPEIQRSGIGSRLMDTVEALATQSGASEIACDTAEGAQHLIELYKRRGYRLVDTVDWQETNYISVILSKELYAARRS